MADGDDIVFDKGDGEDAGHAVPFGTGMGLFVDLVVGERDGFAETVFRGTGLALEAFAQDFNRSFRCMLAGGLSAYAVDDREDAAFGIDIIAVFIIGAAPT